MEPTPHNTGRRHRFATRWLAAINLMGLIVVALWLRCYQLENIPGINGDEAWYGVKAQQLLAGQDVDLRTPTGNPPNPLFLGPVLLLHACFPASFTLLRMAALLSGVAVLVVNWLLCRWVFDRRTATVSTVLLAILPINIAYSRFAWDASQSVLTTLPVLYFSLAAVRFARDSRWRTVVASTGAAVVMLGIAALVHPTNLLAGAVMAAVLATWLRWRNIKRWIDGGRINRRVMAVTCTILVLAVVAVALWAGVHESERFRSRMGDPRELTEPKAAAARTALIPRLLTGATVYQYVGGSRSWFEWPAPKDTYRLGIDILVFWGTLTVAIGFLWRSWKTNGRIEDRVLAAAWAFEIMVFMLIAGPRNMIPGYERYAICLVGPTVLVAARGWSLCYETLRRRRLLLVTASLAAWLILADFQVHYFSFIHRTGGEAHRAFRTGPAEPKQAALDQILRQRGDGTTWIVTTEYWLEWPLRYLAIGEKNLHVLLHTDAIELPEYQQAIREGRVWFVEFDESFGQDGLQKIRAEMAHHDMRQSTIDDYSGRPTLHIFHPLPMAPSG